MSASVTRNPFTHTVIFGPSDRTNIRCQVPAGNVTRRDGAASRRIVEPRSLVNLGRRWYLLAWDAGRDDWRTFRLDRIERVLDAQQGRAAALDLLTTHDRGAVCLTEAAKLLGQKPRAFNIWLSESRWIFRAHDWGTWQAYQRRIDDGVLCHVMVPIQRNDGRRELHPQVKVTSAGLRRLAHMLVTDAQKTGRAVSRTP